MKQLISFVLDGKIVDVRFGAEDGLSPTTTVLKYLRSLPGHRGVKEGCAEGDCGACTVAVGELTTSGKIRYRAVDSCLVFLPALHGKHLVTVENLANAAGELHPVQKALVESHGSQCGFCTPGIVMSMFTFSRNSGQATSDEAGRMLAGNLCRCTGYRPIIEAALKSAGVEENDHLLKEEASTIRLLRSISRQSISLKTELQRYDQPVTLKESLSLIKKFPKAAVINGATDVSLRVTKTFEVIPHIIDLSRVKQLGGISRNKKGLTIGAGTKIADLVDATRSDFPALYDMLKLFGAEQIRNVATLGGNIGTASPISDILPVLLAYKAAVLLKSSRGHRKVGLDRFVTGYRSTDRKKDELITAVELPFPSPRKKIRSYKISKRKDLDIATVNAGFSVEVDARDVVQSVTLSYGGMADRTKRAQQTARFLLGKPWTRPVIESALRLVDKDFAPISDVRGSARFRSIAARNLLMKFWLDTTNKTEDPA